MNTTIDMARQLVIDCPFIVDPQKGHSRIIEQAEHGPCLELTFLIPALSIINTIAEFQQRYEQRQTGHGSAASGAVLSRSAASGAEVSPSAASGAVVSQTQTSSHNGPDGDSGHAETVPAFDLPGQGGSRGSHTIRQGGLASIPEHEPLGTSARDWLEKPEEPSAYRVPDRQQPRDDTTWDTPVEDVYAYVTEDYRARVTWWGHERGFYVDDDALSSMLGEYHPIPLQPPCVGRPTCKPPLSALHESETCKADLLPRRTAKQPERERPQYQGTCQYQFQ